MNVSLNLSPGQLSKLRNGHGIRVGPHMVGSGVDIIIDPMTFHNLSKKLNKGKGAVFKMGPAEINMNKMEGSGLFAGSGNKSGKISRFKKANKWTDFTVGAINKGMDLGESGLAIFNKQKDRQTPQGQLKAFFGGEMEGGNLAMDIKNAYNKNLKNTAGQGKLLKKVMISELLL